MLVIKDVYTQYRCVYPSESKKADSIVKAFKHFLKTSDLVGIVYTDTVSYTHLTLPTKLEV